MPSGNVFDFEQLASSLDQLLPLFEPVTARLMTRLPSLAAGASVLDIACGTGEPGLTLAERCPGIDLLGIDTAPQMIDIARMKAAAKGLSGVRFEVMSSQRLTVTDHSVDAVVSRFGLLSFGDPMVEADQVARVLRPGGTFSLAIWDAESKNIPTYLMASAVRQWLPPQMIAAIEQIEQFAMPGQRESWLAEAGLVDVDSELWSWTVEFADEPSMWDIAASPAILGSVLPTLSGDQLGEARTEFDRVLADYRRSDGSYLLPYACRLIWGSR
jgi:ubiquinone/menaquinone biosynthesis C-methylase UbiE